jgi:hypothetical protein
MIGPSSPRSDAAAGSDAPRAGGSLGRMRLARAESSSELRLFDEAESELVARALIALSQISPGDAAILSRLMSQLADINGLVQAAPSLRLRSVLGGSERDERTLIAHLCHLDGLEGDLALPLKGGLQRTFLVAKFQFMRAFVRATGSLIEQAPQLRPLNLQLRGELAQSIYTQMAEELLLALLRKPDISDFTKKRAATQLIAIWDEATLEIDQFCPLLESAWRARNRITVGLGSLLGASEYFRLVAQDCAPQFLDFFARDEVSAAENQAFTEFLFGLTHEELVQLRAAMAAQGLEAASEAWASRVLGRQIEHECDARDADEIDPISLYRSYSRRQLAADYRILAGTEGPRRTAEAFLMIYLLNQQDDPAP